MSERRVIVYAQKHIDAGDYQEALLILNDAASRFPGNDVIRALKGEAHFLMGDVVLAEGDFMAALSVNAHNEVAKKYIEEIRDVKSLSVSEESQEWLSVARDKVGDFIVLVIGIWLGTTLNTFGAAIKRWKDGRRSKKHFLEGDYVAFTDLLEMQAGENNIVGLRKNIDFMLKHKSADEAKKIIEDYVDFEEIMRMLMRMIDRHEKWAQ